MAKEIALLAQQRAPHPPPFYWLHVEGAVGIGRPWRAPAPLPSEAEATLTHLLAVAVSGPPCGGKRPAPPSGLSLWQWQHVAPGPPWCRWSAPGVFRVLFPFPGTPSGRWGVGGAVELVRQAHPAPWQGRPKRYSQSARWGGAFGVGGEGNSVLSRPRPTELSVSARASALLFALTGNALSSHQHTCALPNFERRREWEEPAGAQTSVLPPALRTPPVRRPQSHLPPKLGL